MSDTEAFRSEPQSDIFFRAVDQLQMASYLSGVKQDLKSLVLYGANRPLLNYYGQAVVRKLQAQFPDSPLKIFASADTESLLENFNAILNEMSFEVATRPQKFNKPLEIWMIDKACTLSIQNLQLFAQLVQNFPGAGICAILLFESKSDNSTNIFRENPRFINWSLEVPTQEQKLSTLQLAKKTDQEEYVLKFFDDLSEKVATDLNPNKSSYQTKSKTQKRHVWHLVMLAFGALSIILAVTAVLRLELGGTVLAFMKKEQKLINKPIAIAKKESSQDILEPEVMLEELPEPATKGLRWLMSLEPNNYVMEYKTFSKLTEAQDYLADQEWLRRAHIVPVFSENLQVAQFMVVDGPYRTSELAKKAAARSVNSHDISIEKVASLLKFATRSSSKSS